MRFHFINIYLQKQTVRYVTNEYWIPDQLFLDMETALLPLTRMIGEKNPTVTMPVKNATYLFIASETTIYESAHYWGSCKTPIAEKKEKMCTGKHLLQL